MNATLRLLPVGLLVLLLQAGFFPAWRPWGVVPDPGLVALVLVAPRWRLSTSLGLALLLGLGTDLAAGANFGLHTGFYLLTVLIMSTLARAGFSVDRFAYAMGAVALGTAAGVLAGAGALLLAGGAMAADEVVRSAAKQLTLNIALLPLLWPLAEWARGRSGSEAREVTI